MFTDPARPLTTRFLLLFQIAPSAKKLWGVDEGGSKDEGGVKGGGILHLGDHQMWRDSTWSTSGTDVTRYWNFPPRGESTSAQDASEKFRFTRGASPRYQCSRESDDSLTLRLRQHAAYLCETALKRSKHRTRPIVPTCPTIPASAFDESHTMTQFSIVSRTISWTRS